VSRSQEEVVVGGAEHHYLTLKRGHHAACLGMILKKEVTEIRTRNEGCPRDDHPSKDRRRSYLVILSLTTLLVSLYLSLLDLHETDLLRCLSLKNQQRNQ
jgi:hypothetical protein